MIKDHKAKDDECDHDLQDDTLWAIRDQPSQFESSLEPPEDNLNSPPVSSEVAYLNCGKVQEVSEDSNSLTLGVSYIYETIDIVGRVIPTSKEGQPV